MPFEFRRRFGGTDFVEMSRETPARPNVARCLDNPDAYRPNWPRKLRVEILFSRQYHAEISRQRSKMLKGKIVEDQNVDRGERQNVEMNFVDSNFFKSLNA